MLLVQSVRNPRISGNGADTFRTILNSITSTRLQVDTTAIIVTRSCFDVRVQLFDIHCLYEQVIGHLHRKKEEKTIDRFDHYKLEKRSSHRLIALPRASSYIKAPFRHTDSYLRCVCVSVQD